MFEAIRQAGFDHVRISINWNCHTHKVDDNNLYVIDQAWLDRLDWVVASVLTRDLAAIVNMHFNWDYVHGRPGARDQFISIWTQLADHFQNYPKQLFFEILNEPTKIADATLGADYAAVIQIIRANNPYRTIIYDGNEWAKAYELPVLEQYLPSGEKNLIGTDHYYDPNCFALGQNCPSSQNVDWPISDPSAYSGDAGDAVAADSEAAVKNHFDSVAAISQQIGRPIYLGEFGAESTRDQASRGLYIGAVARNAERVNVGWANWSFTATFDAWHGLVGWYPDVIAALRPDYTPPSN